MTPPSPQLIYLAARTLSSLLGQKADYVILRKERIRLLSDDVFKKIIPYLTLIVEMT